MPIRELTRPQIETSSYPFGTVANYCDEFRIAFGGEAVSQLSSSLQRMLMILDLVCEVENGGYWQYFGNRTDDSDLLFEEVELVPTALAVAGANELSEVTIKATKRWMKLLDDDCDEDCSWELSTEPYRAGDDWRLKVRRELGPLDDLFYAISAESLATVSEYIVEKQMKAIADWNLQYYLATGSIAKQVP